MNKAKFAVIGLGVMGQNLALNVERNGYPVAVYNRTTSTTKAFIEGSAAGKNIVGTYSIQELVDSLEKPRKILMLVKAGDPVDAVINQLKPLLDIGDILIDGGNSLFLDTERRNKALTDEGFYYIGTGVSGGEEGALWGPSIMPGGNREAWEALKEILIAISAKADDGEPCVDYIGPRGAGHYVKMVHNGIEYGDMQLIAEAYDLLHRGLNIPAELLGAHFSEWNDGILSSYLIEITARILKTKDQETGKPIVDVILDEAKQKGTGKWTSQNALDLGAPTHTINAAVSSRIISAMKEERVVASKVLHGPETEFAGDPEKMIAAVKDALYASKILSYAQGFGLMRLASEEYDYNLNMGNIAKIWRAGCIIRARLLDDIMRAYDRDPSLTNLLLDDFFRQAVEQRQQSMRTVIKTAIDLGIPIYAMSASLAYFDAYRTARLPANLTQAQRDFFGAHTYRRVDKEGSFHTQWTD